MICFEEEVMTSVLMPAKHHYQLQLSHHILMSRSFFKFFLSHLHPACCLCVLAVLEWHENLNTHSKLCTITFSEANLKLVCFFFISPEMNDAC